MNTKVKPRFERIARVVFLRVLQATYGQVDAILVDMYESNLNNCIWNNKGVLANGFLEGN